MRHLTREPAVADGRDTAASRFSDEITSLLSTGSFSWALETLSGIRATVERTGYVTAKQRRAVQHISDGLWDLRGRRF